MKIQSYSSLNSFLLKSEAFWAIHESINSLFWEFAKKPQISRPPKAMFNVFLKSKIIGSALITGPSYLLLSRTKPEAIERMGRYLIRRKEMISGIIGPEDEVNCFLQFLKSEKSVRNVRTNKKYLVFESGVVSSASDSDFVMEEVGVRGWPRARAWAQAFALESVPPLDSTQTVQLAKAMSDAGKLFLLKDKTGKTYAMGGFGRTTCRSVVINMIYVGPEARRQGKAGMLVRKLQRKAHQLAYRNCILFSDFFGGKNLYRQLGFLESGCIKETSFDLLSQS